MQKGGPSNNKFANADKKLHVKEVSPIIEIKLHLVQGKSRLIFQFSDYSSQLLYIIKYFFYVSSYDLHVFILECC